MVVTFTAAHGRAQENLRRVANPVGHVLGQVLFGLSTALAGCLKQHVEARRYLLLDAGFREQVPGQLLDDKLIVRLV